MSDAYQRTFVDVPIASAIRALKLEYKSLQEEPVEGFRVKLVDESNIFEWEVAIFGPPNTIYQGGYFKALMKFPRDYPYGPPTFRFLTKFWHPNVFATGGLCISILHAQDSEAARHLKASEKWSPAQNVRTVLLSAISLLSEPNVNSPANVDACKMYIRWKESNGKFNEYEKLVKWQVKQSKAEAKKDGVVVPTTVEEYCKLAQVTRVEKEENDDDVVETMDYYVDQGDDDDDDDDDNDDGEDEGKERSDERDV